MAVETLADERDEEVARVHRAAVGGDAGEGGRRAGEAPVDRARRFLEAHHRFLAHRIASVHRAPLCHSASAARATSRSLKGWRTPAISW